MNISCITRSNWVNPQTLNTKPESGNGGGGIVTKYLSFAKCCPDIHFTDDFGDENLRTIVIIEPLSIRIKDVVAEESRRR